MPGEISFELVESIFLDESEDAATSNLDRIKDLGIDIEILSRYSGWQPVYGSQLQSDFLKAAGEVYEGTDVKPEIISIHAGLECGIIVPAMGGIDAISIGPDASDIHTPSESLGLESTEKFWSIIEKLLKM